MSKKSRHARRPIRRPRTPPLQKAQQPSALPSAAASPRSAGTASAAPMQVGGLREDYSYVYGDLKRIAILAGSILAIMIILSFIIR